jgi:ABC-type antimicrobial peptide transport system permease subunit
MALGARARDVVSMLLKQSLRPILLGVTLGVLGGFGLSRLFNAIFFRMAPFDPPVFAGITLLMVSVALAAAWFPVHRVTRIDPQHTLRYE